MPEGGLERGPHLLDASMFWGHVGGVRRVISTKHAMLGAYGWRHTVLAPGAQGPGLVDCGGLPLPMTGGYRVVVGRGRVERLIEQIGPDIIEAADPYRLAWAVLGAAERLRVPTVAFCHSDLPALAARLLAGRAALATRRGRWAAGAARAYLVDLYARFDHVLAPSATLAERLRAWGVAGVAVQPLGVDCSVFNPAARDPLWRRQTCQRFGLEPDTRLLIYSGRFAAEKNLPLLAEAVRLLGPGHALLAIGTGPLPPHGPRVFVLAPERARALARAIASCDAYVHAGDQESFGLGVLEAMACGTPVVVSAGCGTAEVAGETGLAVPRQHAPDWAEAMRAGLSSAGSARVQAALRRARAHDWSSVIEQMSCRYRALIGRRAQVRTRALQ
jgi:alpha-1,6-mannosyltransferase